MSYSGINIISNPVFTSGVLFADTYNAPNGSVDSIPSLTKVTVNGSQVTVDAALEIQSIQGALLIPRVNTAQKNNIIPCNGMMVYDTNLNEFSFYQAGMWIEIGSTTVNSVTGTPFQITATPNIGNVVLSFPDILNSKNNILDDGLGNATFVSLTADNLTASLPVVTSGTKQLISGAINLGLSSNVTGILGSSNGGTGTNNGTSAITIGGNLTFSGAFSFSGTLSGNTNVTFPTSGTLTTTANTVASITGTTNQISASASTGAVTLSFPSVLHSQNNTLDDGSGNAAFGSITDNNLTASQAVATNGSKQLTSIAYSVSNTANSFVQRDVSGNFSANTITASLTGLASLNVPLAGGTITGAIINYTTMPSNALELVPKQYVDSLATGINVHTPARVATTGSNLTATYNNGSSGVGATLTNSSTQVAISIDGVSLSVNDRVLIKDQSTTFQNGIYTVTTVGSGSTNWVLTRATDFNSSANITQGSFVLITGGSTNGGTQWVQTGTGPFTVGTTAIIFTLFNTAANISAGNGLNLSGNIMSLVTPVSLANGGTNANLSASNGGIVWSNATQLQILSGTATANLPLLSGSTTTPSWGAFALSLGGAFTTAGAFTTSGTFSTTLTVTGATNVTLPTSGTLATTANTVASITGTANEITASASTGPVTLSFPSVLHSANGNVLDDGSKGCTFGSSGAASINLGNTGSPSTTLILGTTNINNSSNAATNIGTSAYSGTVSIGNSLSTLSTLGVINVNTSGASAVNIGTGSYTGTVSIGNSLSTLSTLGVINVNTSGASAVNIGTGSYTGTVTIGGNGINIGASSSTVSIQPSTGSNQTNICSSSGYSGTITFGNHGGPSVTNFDGIINFLSTSSFPGIIPRDTFSYTFFGGF